MLISDISVRRPVFAAVISLILVVMGLLAVQRMSIQEYPDMESPVVTISTSYRGAAADVVERRVTQVIEDQIAGVEGISKVTSTSFDELSSISVEFNFDRDIDSATNDIRDRVQRVLDQLPEEANPPEVTKENEYASVSMWVDLSSTKRSPIELTDYAERYLVDALSIVNGVATIRISGERRPAMRIWLDPQKLAARGLTVADVENALRRENVQIPSGRLESSQREFTLRTDTGFIQPSDFESLVLSQGADNYLVRLGEVAQVEMAAEDDRNFSRTDGRPGTSLGISPQAKANILQVNRDLVERIASLRSSLPSDISMSVNVDNSYYIAKSLREVGKALGVALLLVLIVIFGFVGSLRATLIPAVTIPVSIIASFIVMQWFGFSINSLTLLGLVLAIGLVVDDAIVVLENIVRRIELKEPPLLAATNGSREIAFAVIATTMVLVAVFLPVSYLEGSFGSLFKEFGISLAAAVLFSSLIALTLVPMLTSKLFADGLHRGRVSAVVDRAFRRLSRRYETLLHSVIRHPWIIISIAAVIFTSSLLLLEKLPKEYSPPEDRGMIMLSITAPDGASMEYTDRYARIIEEYLLEDRKLHGDTYRILTRSGAWGSGRAVNKARMFIVLTDWDTRTRSAAEIASAWNKYLWTLPGVNAYAFPPGSWAIGQSGRPLQIVLGGTDYDQLAAWRDTLMAEAEKLPGLSNLESDYQERKPKIDVTIDRDRAADLGVSLQTVGRTLETILGSRVVTSYISNGEEYRVILQGLSKDRQTPSDLDNIYVRSDRTRQLIPLSNLVTLREIAGPVDLRRFDRMRAITVSASIEQGNSLQNALTDMENIIHEKLPESVQINYNGESREFKNTAGSLYLTFLFALIVVYLVLAAQFESFKHPFIIMTTVPLAITGALVGLQVFGSSINIYSQIGAIMLIGLSAKNGILIVEFANQLRDRGKRFRPAIVEAASIRLRPVLMTSLCTAFGTLPLLLASGAGAESRQSIGAVVFFGVTISVLLTLVVVPAVYVLVARNSHSPEYIGQLIDKLKHAASAQGVTKKKVNPS